MKRRHATACLLGALVLLGACRDQDQLRSLGYARPGSINGLEVLRAALAERWQVDAVPGIGTHLDDYDCAVLVCRETRLPERPFWDWCEQWLEQDDRCLVLVLRDGDVTAPLCRRWSQQARAAAAQTNDRQLAERLRAEAKEMARLALLPAERPVGIGAYERSGPWLRLHGVPPGRPHALNGNPPFAPTPATPLTLNPGCRLEAAFGMLEPLVADELGTLVGLRRYQTGRMIVCASATALLDGALVGPAAREQLDALLMLIAEDTPKRVAWLRDHVHASDEYHPRPTLWSMIARPPFGLILLHMLILVLIYLAYRAAWLGRREAEPEGRPPRFRDHVLALGNLLHAAHARRRVHSALARYHQRPSPSNGVDDSHTDLASARRLWGERSDHSASRPSAMETPDG